MQISWFFPIFIFSLTFNKIPWLFPDFCQVWNFPDFCLTAGHPAMGCDYLSMPQSNIISVSIRGPWRHCHGSIWIHWAIEAMTNFSGRHFADAIFRIILLKAIVLFWIIFHWNLFPSCQLQKIHPKRKLFHYELNFTEMCFQGVNSK